MKRLGAVCHRDRWRRLLSTALDDSLLPTSVTQSATNGLIAEHHPAPVPSNRSYFEAMGFDARQVDRLLWKHPELAKAPPKQPLSAKLEFLSEKGMSRRGVVRFFSDVLSVYPEFLDLDLEADIQPVFKYLMGLGLTDEQCLVMIIQYPHLVGYDVNMVFRSKIEFLEEMGYTIDEIKKIMVEFPQLFGVSLDSNVRPMTTYLMQEMDLTADDLKKLFLKCPHLFGVRVAAARAKLDFFIQSGFEAGTIRSLMKRFPTVLRASLSNSIRPTIELLLQYASHDTLRKVFERCPQCLCMSYADEILPKFHFLVQMGYDPKDLNVMLDRFPELLCYSLEDEIMPTVERSVEVGLSLLETRITFAREPEVFREAIAKVTRDIDKEQP